jgi:hypothetical protein
MDRRPSLVLLTLAAALLAPSGCGQQEPRPPTRAVERRDARARLAEPRPAWFTLEYRMITHFPTCRGNTRVKIDRDGKVWFMRSDRDCPRGVDFSAPYPDRPKAVLSPAERDGLLDLIVKGRFLDLVAPARGAAQDGYREEIAVDLAGRQRTVVVHHGARLAGWDEVKAAVLGYTH